MSYQDILIQVLETLRGVKRITSEPFTPTKAVNRKENATRLWVFRIDLSGINCPKQSPVKAGPCLVKLPGSNFITLKIKFNESNYIRTTWW